MPADIFSGSPGAEQLLRFLEESSGAGVFDYDLRSEKVRWSAGMFALFEIDSHTVEPTIELFRTFVHPQDRFGADELRHYIDLALPFERTLRIILQDGRTRWLSTSYEFLLDSTGKAARMLGLTMDVTAQRIRHVSMIAAHERFKGMVMGVAPVVFAANADGAITEIYGWERISGRTNSSALGDGWTSALHPEDREAAVAAWQSRNKMRFYEHECRLVAPDGTVRYIRGLAVPNGEADDKVVEWSGMILDLTVQRAETPPNAGLATGAQIRAARGMLKWSVSDLSAASGVSPAVIRRLEEYDVAAPKSRNALEVIRQTLEAAGIDLVFSPDQMPGVRLARIITEGE